MRILQHNASPVIQMVIMRSHIQIAINAMQLSFNKQQIPIIRQEILATTAQHAILQQYGVLQRSAITVQTFH